MYTDKDGSTNHIQHDSRERIQYSDNGSPLPKREHYFRKVIEDFPHEGSPHDTMDVGRRQFVMEKPNAYKYD